MQMKNVKKLTEKLCVIKNVAPPPKLPLGLCLTAPLKQDERLFFGHKTQSQHQSDCKNANIYNVFIAN